MTYRLVDLHAYVAGFDDGPPIEALQNAAERLLAAEEDAIRRATAGWAAQAGVSVEEWAKSFGFKTVHVYEETTVTVRVEPVALGYDPDRTLTRVVFRQPPAMPPDR